MNFSELPLDTKLHVKYNEHGESFENLLVEIIKQVNFQAVQKQTITNTTLTKESAKNE